VLRKSALKDLPLSVLVCQVRESAYVLVCEVVCVCVYAFVRVFVS
jgi:hypothetical protein